MHYSACPTNQPITYVLSRQSLPFFTSDLVSSVMWTCAAYPSRILLIPQQSYP